ncbi:MAG: hypothetical protein ACLQAH_07055 [Limisphaerales bacterium]
MTRLGKIAVCLAGGLALSASARADDAAPAGNPYTPIVVRNVFGLNPPSTNNPADSADPPPKITPNGIMSIFGQLQVLFKVAPKPGDAGAKEVSYVLSEGQREDDIEVTHIDERDSLITFNNHGTVQELPLANAPAITTPGAAAPGGNALGQPAGLNRNVPGPGFAPGRFGGNGPAAARSRGFGGPGAPGAPGGGIGGAGSTMGGTTGMGGGQAAQTGSQMTPEEAAALIEVQRAQYESEGNSSLAKILPPTPLTRPPNNNGQR